MIFNLFGFDFMIFERCYGFWVGSIDDIDNNFHRNLFGIYWADGELMVDFLFLQIV